MQRKTYALIDGEKLTQNVKEIKKKYPDYTYYIGVVKNNAYHHGIRSVLDLIEGGINYLAVSSLEEAHEIRKYERNIPILCLEPISLDAIFDALNENVTITIESLEYLKELEKVDLFSEIKIHLKIDSGMHRLGFYEKRSLNEAVEMIQKNEKMILEGIYTHFASLGITDSYWDYQVQEFLKITEDINLKEIPIVHLGRSATLVEHPKISFCNGVRLGIIMYGFSQSRKEGGSIKDKLRSWKRRYLQKKNHCSETYLTNDLELSTAFSLYSHIMSERKVEKGSLVGYSLTKVLDDGYIYTIPIGYADGVTKEFQEVAIEGKRYPILSDSMDMIMIFSKEKLSLQTKVEIFGKTISIKEVCGKLSINAYHLFNQISNRVVRIHKNKEREEEITY